jgi:hypothetical protein
MHVQNKVKQSFDLFIFVLRIRTKTITPIPFLFVSVFIIFWKKNAAIDCGQRSTSICCKVSVFI